MEGYGMHYERPDLTKLDEADRAGEFAAEYHTRHAFNDAGEVIARTREASFKITKAIPAYIKEQEALFQQEQQKLTAENNNPFPDTPQP